MKLIGGEQLAKKLERMSRGEQGKVIRPALRDGAKIIAAEIKQRTPVASGRLKRGGIKVRAAKRSRKRLAGITTNTPTREQLDIPAKNPVYYPAIVEDMPGHSWIRAAARAKESQAQQAMRDRVRRGVLELAR